MAAPAKSRILVQTAREGEPIVVQVSSYSGSNRLDIRHFWSPDGPDGDVAPTKKGVSVPVEKGEELIDAIRKVLDEFAKA